MRTAEQYEAMYQGVRPSRVAEALECSTAHVLALIKAGELDAVDISVGKRPEYRISKDSFEEFLKERRVA